MNNTIKMMILGLVIIIFAIMFSPAAQARVSYVAGVGQVSDICRSGAYWIRLSFQPIGTPCYIVDSNGTRWNGFFVYEYQ